MLVQREVHYGFYGSVYGSVAVVELTSPPAVHTGKRSSVLRWGSSGVRTGDEVEVLTAPDQGAVVARQRDLLRLYPLP